MSEAQIASTVECSVGTVKSQTARGLANLRAHLQRAAAQFDDEEADVNAYTDDELAERISRGDWALDVDPPALEDVVGEVRRQRRRRTTIGAGVVTGPVAAAAVTAVVGLTPDRPSAQDPRPPARR